MSTSWEDRGIIEILFFMDVHVFHVLWISDSMDFVFEYFDIDLWMMDLE